MDVCASEQRPGVGYGLMDVCASQQRLGVGHGLQLMRSGCGLPGHQLWLPPYALHAVSHQMSRLLIWRPVDSQSQVLPLPPDDADTLCLILATILYYLWCLVMQLTAQKIWCLNGDGGH